VAESGAKRVEPARTPPLPPFVRHTPACVKPVLPDMLPWLSELFLCRQNAMKPDSPLSGIVTACFFGTWIVLGIAGFFLFYRGRDTDFKRKWFPRFVVLVGILFVGFATTLFYLPTRSTESLRMLFFVVPATCVISWLNIKFTRFCDSCGHMIHNHNWFSPMNFCPKCGAELDAKKAVHRDPLD